MYENADMPLQSAGLLLYRITGNAPQVLLVHPGGLYYTKRDTGVWSVPKGLFESDEEPLSAARREFREETGYDPPSDGYLPLTPIRMKGGKIVHAWAVAGDIDETRIVSNQFRMEYPYKSGRFGTYPEVDRAAWLHFGEGAEKIIPAQLPFLQQLEGMLRDY